MSVAADVVNYRERVVVGFLVISGGEAVLCGGTCEPMLRHCRMTCGIGR